jgi:hypothetical protein
MLAECFDVPGKVLADRTGCLKGGVVDNVVVPAGSVRAVRRNGPDLRLCHDLHQAGVPPSADHRHRPGIPRNHRPPHPEPRIAARSSGKSRARDGQVPAQSPMAEGRQCSCRRACARQ